MQATAARALLAVAILGFLVFNPLWVVDKDRPWNFWPLLYWAAQWLVFWCAAAGTALAVRNGGLAGNRWAWAGLAVLGLSLAFTLPELSDMNVTGRPARLGIAEYLRIKLERSR